MFEEFFLKACGDGIGADGDVALRIDDAMPRDLVDKIIGERVQSISGKSRVSFESGDARDLAIACNSAVRDFFYDGVDAGVEGGYTV